jgi:ATP-binding cassette, subfamily C (CFTR/MRP), member 1
MFRGSMVSLIYARTLKLQDGVYDESKALTLMSTDIDSIGSNIQTAMDMWAKVIEIAIGVWLLERQLGWVCIAPIIVTIGLLYCP